MAHRLLRIFGALDIIAGGVMSLFPAIPIWLSGFVIFIGFTILAVEMPGMYSDVAPHVRRLLVRGPIAWNFEGFLGASRFQGEDVYISVFQPSGRSRRRGVVLDDAFIRSSTTGHQIPVRIKTDGGYVETNELNPIPAGATVFAQALFYDPDQRKAGNREGMPEDKFIADWGGFEFFVSYLGHEFRYKFSLKDIQNQIDRVKPQGPPRPRVTRRSKSSQ